MWERPRPGAASSCGLLAKGSGRQSAAGSKAQEGLRLLAAQKMDDCKKHGCLRLCRAALLAQSIVLGASRDSAKSQISGFMALCRFLLAVVRS
jgi:hypothetical protein